METYGNRDPRLSDFRKCWIGTDKVTVVGAWGTGTSKEITSSWVSPFEGQHLGGQAPGLLGNIAQAATKWTTVSTLNTLQTWQGNRPTSFSLEMKLYALEDPETEVMQPLRALEMMMAPDVGTVVGLGSVPDTVTLNIGTKIIYTDLVIESMSVPFDKEMDLLGRFVRVTVNLSLSTLTMVSKDMLRQGYGLQGAPSTEKNA